MSRARVGERIRAAQARRTPQVLERFLLFAAKASSAPGVGLEEIWGLKRIAGAGAGEVRGGSSAQWNVWMYDQSMLRKLLLLFALCASLLVHPVGQLATLRAQQPSPAKKEQPKSQTVYITRTGKKYHADGCRYLSRSRVPIALKDAKARGFTACSVCRPAQ